MEGKARVLGEKHAQQPEMIIPTSLQMEDSQRHENIAEFN